MNTFTRSYVECALWSSTDNSDDSGGEPLDANYGIDDIAPETMARMIEDCANFQKDEAENLEASGLDDSRAGFLFWLNRNGHGSGFWDEGIGELGTKLSGASKAWGTFDLYIGDDNLIHGS